MSKPRKGSITPCELLSIEDQKEEALAWVFEHINPEEIFDNWGDFDLDDALDESEEAVSYWKSNCEVMIRSSLRSEYDYKKSVECFTTAMGYAMLYKQDVEESEIMLKCALEALQGLPSLTREQQTKVLNGMCRFGFRILAAIFAMHCNVKNISSKRCLTLAEELIGQPRWWDAI